MSYFFLHENGDMSQCCPTHSSGAPWDRSRLRVGRKDKRGKSRTLIKLHLQPHWLLTPCKSSFRLWGRSPREKHCEISFRADWVSPFSLSKKHISLFRDHEPDAPFSWTLEKLQISSIMAFLYVTGLSLVLCCIVTILAIVYGRILIGTNEFSYRMDVRSNQFRLLCDPIV